jgi:hypothetical protein
MMSNEVASMYAEIVNGKPKAKSLYANTDAESSAMWDKITNECAEIRSKDHHVGFDIPNEVP